MMTPGEPQMTLSAASGPEPGPDLSTFARPRRSAYSRVVLPIAVLVADAVVVVGSILLAAYLRTQTHLMDKPTDVAATVREVSTPMLVGWLAMLWLFGTYRPHQLSAGTEQYRNVTNATVVAAGLTGIGCYLRQEPLSRGFFVLTFVIGLPLLVITRYVLRRVLHAARRQGRFHHRVLVAGDGLHIDEICTILARETWLGYHFVGALSASSATSAARTARGFSYVGRARDASEAAVRLDADVIVVAGGAFTSPAELRRMQWALEHQRVQVIVAPSVTDIARERVRVRPMGGLPLVHLEPPRGAGVQRLAKRGFDLLAAGGAVLVLSPVLLGAALVVRWSGDGPILFRQVRVGRDGRTFAIFKFRTMVVGAESLRSTLIPQNQSDGVLFKLVADPRVTGPGRWLRRYSIDELPQLLNVLRGEMSLVGPRPALPDEVSRYEADVLRRLRVRPGITGLWQVSGRSNLSWEDTVRLDLYYVDNWSMVQDLLILARTVRAVTSSHGAY